MKIYSIDLLPCGVKRREAKPIKILIIISLTIRRRLLNKFEQTITSLYRKHRYYKTILKSYSLIKSHIT